MKVLIFRCIIALSLEANQISLSSGMDLDTQQECCWSVANERCISKLTFWPISCPEIKRVQRQVRG